MSRRSAALGGALVLALAVPTTATSAVAAPVPKHIAAPGVVGNEDPGQALRRLRAAAEGPLRVQRDADGRVDHLASSEGEAVLPAPASADTPREAVTAQLDRFGEAFGIDGEKSEAVVRRTLPSSTGGTVVRAEQVVDGVPVFGGQVVMSLDEDNGVVAVDAATAGATSVPAPVIGDRRARAIALATVAKQHRVARSDLAATSVGRRLYDPAVVGVTDIQGARPVWQFEVTDGLGIKETVLIGTSRGEVALRFNDAPRLHRVVCDNANDDTSSGEDPVPTCLTPARAEGDAATAQADVDAAYDHLGATAATYDELGDIDLTDLVGVTTGGTKKLLATVRWCFEDDECPFPNAFWDGRQMVFGQGYAAADDVVAHELTHGYVDRTAGLFSLHQSGAINESVSDTLGEIVDHRNPGSPASDAGWTIGEDLPEVGLSRNFKDPALDGQPDRMRSPDYRTADFYEDYGAVHHNMGVGNKTAYLISQGGTFNGQTVTGIDVGDATLAQTGLLYLEAIPRLTSGAQYADLGRVLGATCDELAAGAVGGFTSSDCAQVRKVVLATELDLAPLDPAATAPDTAQRCPAGLTPLGVEATDDDATREFATSFGSLWQRTPDNDTIPWSRSGTSSWFGWNPDPELGGPTTSSAVLGEFQVPNDGKARSLSFHHAYLFEYDGSDYYDGGQVFVQTLDANGTTWTTHTAPAFLSNGPNRSLLSSSIPGFAGDSRGYGTSVLDLRPYAGKTVRVQFRVVGDESVSLLGWYIDNIQLNSCWTRVPGAPTMQGALIAGSGISVTWSAPASVGSGITGYQVLADGRVLRTVSGSVRRVVVTPPSRVRPVAFSVRARNAYGDTATSGAHVVTTSTTTITAPARAKKRRGFVVNTVVLSRSSRFLGGMPVSLQRRYAGTSRWITIARGTTALNGNKAWSVSQVKAASYRIVSGGFRGYFGSVSPTKVVLKKGR